MHRNPHKHVADGSDGSPPSEAWLFAQAILGNPIPRIISPEVQARAKRQELENQAQFSPRHAEELRRLQAAEAEARRQRGLLEWAAQISTACESKLRKLCQEKFISYVRLREWHDVHQQLHALAGEMGLYRRDDEPQPRRRHQDSPQRRTGRGENGGK